MTASVDVVSVVVTTYNRRTMTLEALDSIFGQTYRPIELVIVDDGSTDDTGAAVKNWIERTKADGSFVTKYLRQENAGAPAARNRGNAVSTGRFVQWWDSDDLMFPDKIKIQVDEMVKTGSQWSVCDEWKTGCQPIGVNTESPPTIYTRKLTLDDFFDDLGRASFITGSILVQRGLVDQVGPWDENLPIRQDTDFALRLLLADVPNVYVMVPLYILGTSTRGITRSGLKEHWQRVHLAWQCIEEKHRKSEVLRKRLEWRAGLVFAAEAVKLWEAGECKTAESAYKHAAARLRGLTWLTWVATWWCGRAIGFPLAMKIRRMIGAAARKINAIRPSAQPLLAHGLCTH